MLSRLLFQHYAMKIINNSNKDPINLLLEYTATCKFVSK